MYNRWMGLEDTPFARWNAIFKHPISSDETESLLDFAGNLIKAGDEEAVFRINKKDPAFPGTYSAFTNVWQTSWQSSGILPLFDIRIDENWKLMRDTSGRICYFDETGQVNEAEVGNVRAFLQAHSKSGENFDAFIDDVSILDISSNSVKKKDFENHSTYFVVIAISIHTDLWFPRILAPRHTSNSLSSTSPIWYDNSELALCHTPRLNQFLKKAHQLTMESGGRWERIQPEGIAKDYTSMVGEDFIYLPDSLT